MSKKDLAYFAGFFDGEGCISISTKKATYNKSLKTYGLSCRVTSTNLWILELMKFQFGGSVQVQKTILGYKPKWQWGIYTKKALVFLREIYPYLKLKRPEAEVAMRWQEKRVAGRHQVSNQLAIDEAEKILLQSLKRI